MAKENLTPIEAAVQMALRGSPETDQLPAEEIIEVAELGRKHPRFDEAMARIARSPSSLALYRATRESMATGGLRQVSGSWMEGLKSLPKWFEQTMLCLQSTPVPAYRSGPTTVPEDLRLLSPDPLNQSIFPGTQDWLVASDRSSVTIQVEDREVGVQDAVPVGQQVTVTICPTGDSWSLENEAVYRFKVLSEEEEAQAKWAIENAQELPLSAALVFCSLGLFAESKKLLEQWTSDPDLEAFAGLIKSMCEARRADARQFYLRGPR